MNAIEKEKLFWSILFREGLKQAKQRKEEFKGKIPAGHFLLKGIHHSYLVKIKNTKKIGKKIYYETYVVDYAPNDDNGEHLNERHNLLLNKNDKRKVIVILNH